VCVCVVGGLYTIKSIFHSKKKKKKKTARNT
jgi:hypothetical protein